MKSRARKCATLTHPHELSTFPNFNSGLCRGRVLNSSLTLTPALNEMYIRLRKALLLRSMLSYGAAILSRNLSKMVLISLMGSLVMMIVGQKSMSDGSSIRD
jgi:hypothetical protein